MDYFYFIQKNINNNYLYLKLIKFKKNNNQSK